MGKQAVLSIRAENTVRAARPIAVVTIGFSDVSTNMTELETTLCGAQRNWISQIWMEKLTATPSREFLENCSLRHHHHPVRYCVMLSMTDCALDDLSDCKLRNFQSHDSWDFLFDNHRALSLQQFIQRTNEHGFEFAGIKLLRCLLVLLEQK